MENLSNVSSEEELLQLRNEGKISEDEYEELRSAMRKSAKPEVEPPLAPTNKAKLKHKLAKVAFILMSLGIILPSICFMAAKTLAPPNACAASDPWFFLGLALEIPAFVIGVIAWPDAFAKATVATISFIIVLAFFFALLART